MALTHCAITFANAAFGRMVGRAPDALPGQPWTQFLSPAQDRNAVVARLGEPGFRGELLLLRNSVDPVPVLVVRAASRFAPTWKPSACTRCLSMDVVPMTCQPTGNL